MACSAVRAQFCSPRAVRTESRNGQIHEDFTTCRRLAREPAGSTWSGRPEAVRYAVVCGEGAVCFDVQARFLWALHLQLGFGPDHGPVLSKDFGPVDPTQVCREIHRKWPRAAGILA
jgi:hypothetical protein